MTHQLVSHRSFAMVNCHSKSHSCTTHCSNVIPGSLKWLHNYRCWTMGSVTTYCIDDIFTAAYVKLQLSCTVAVTPGAVQPPRAAKPHCRLASTAACPDSPAEAGRSRLGPCSAGLSICRPGLRWSPGSTASASGTASPESTGQPPAPPAPAAGQPQTVAAGTPSSVAGEPLWWWRRGQWQASAPPAWGLGGDKDRQIVKGGGEEIRIRILLFARYSQCTGGYWVS